MLTNLQSEYVYRVLLSWASEIRMQTKDNEHWQLNLLDQLYDKFEIRELKDIPIKTFNE
tara:strand:- start:105 stop:281 length:177 start_codon:yes stop_codon:yes gene_type:complete